MSVRHPIACCINANVDDSYTATERWRTFRGSGNCECAEWRQPGLRRCRSSCQYSTLEFLHQFVECCTWTSCCSTFVPSATLMSRHIKLSHKVRDRPKPQRYHHRYCSRNRHSYHPPPYRANPSFQRDSCRLSCSFGIDSIFCSLGTGICTLHLRSRYFALSTW